MFTERYAVKKDFTINPSLYVIQCGTEDCLPGHWYGPCFRDHNLIHFILKGKGVLEIQEKEISLSAGQGFLIPTGVTAKYIADLDDPWEYCWMGFDGENSDSVMSYRGLSSVNNLFTFKEPNKILDCIQVMIESYGNYGNDFTTISKMFEIFSYINPQYSVSPNQANTISSVFEYIEKHFAENITIEGLAKHFNLSRTQLFRYFKESVNMPPQQYIKRYRINYAADLLRTTNKTVDEIRELSGFNDLCNFSRQFSNVYKRSPQAFRKYVNSHIDNITAREHSPTGPHPKNKKEL